MLQSGTYKTRYQRRQVLEGLCGILLVRGVEVGEPAVDEPGFHPNLDRSFQTHERNSGRKTIQIQIGCTTKSKSQRAFRVGNVEVV